MSIIDEIRQDSSGLLFLRDWLGDAGQTVTTEQAEERAKVCIGCPQNTHPNWWERWVKDPIANAIRKELEIKTRMNLRLHQDDKLNMCKACGCCTRLKVWAPIAHIKSHTDAAMLNKFPEHCWIRGELLSQGHA